MSTANRARLLATASLLAILGAAGCRARGDARAKHILSAYRAFDEAKGADKRPALQALSSAPCAAETCGARDACVRYATALLEARTNLDHAKNYGPVDGGGLGAATPSAYAVILGAADDASKEAAAAEPACAEGLLLLSKLADR